MAKSKSKSLNDIIKQGNAEKKRIDDRIKSAKAKAGRAYFDFLNSNYDVKVSKFSNGRIKLMKIKGNGKNIKLTKHTPRSGSNSSTSNEVPKSDYQSAVNNNKSSSTSDDSTQFNPFKDNQK